MSSSFGKNIKIQLFGQSHSECIGVVIDGLPANVRLDMEMIERYMQRRAPGQSSLTTPRNESDTPRIVSGLVDGLTCGAPLCALFANKDTKSSDYDEFKTVPRPSHADYTAYIKTNGANDVRGGGHFSARLTAPLVFAGAICVQLLEMQGITIGAHISSISNICDKSFDTINLTAEELLKLKQKDFPTLDETCGMAMQDLVKIIAKEGDSIGGVIECCILNLPVGIGEPIFEGLESHISAAIFAIPAVKGIEFGSGFSGSKLKGSENNDSFYYDSQIVKTRTNNHGGILGGLSSGMPLLFNTAFKPTPSIAQEQDSVNLLTKENTKIMIKGRHDTCVVTRAVPCVEAAAAIAIYDLIREK